MKSDNGSSTPTQEAESTTVTPADKTQGQQNSVDKPAPRVSLYEKNRRAVYATGNKWAIENFHATHD